MCYFSLPIFMNENWSFLGFFYISIYLVLIYFILFYYCFLGACLFSRERQKDYGSRWEGRCWGTGRSRGRRKPTQNILDENNLFAIKEKTIANPVTHSFPLVINKNQIDNKVQIKYKMLIMNWNLQVIVIDIFLVYAKQESCGMGLVISGICSLSK